MAGFVTHIERDTIENEDYRRVLYTGPNTKLVLMTLQPGAEGTVYPTKADEPSEH